MRPLDLSDYSPSRDLAISLPVNCLTSPWSSFAARTMNYARFIMFARIGRLWSPKAAGIERACSASITAGRMTLRAG